MQVNEYKVANLVLCGIVWFDSLMMIPSGLKHVGIFSLILYYKHLRNNTVHSVS
jgi:hypothetical protein